MGNTESVAKEAMLTFFIETAEPYLMNFDAKTLNKINRWVCKITQLNVYSMRTHLLLLHQMIKKGQLSPPFSNEPATTNLPQFDPTSTKSNPDLNRILQLFAKPSESVDTTASGNEIQDSTINFEQAAEYSELESSNPSNQIPRRVEHIARNFTIPIRRTLSSSRIPRLQRPTDDRAYTGRSYFAPPIRAPYIRPRGIPTRALNSPYYIQETDRCTQTLCQERITNYNSPSVMSARHSVDELPMVSTPRRGACHTPDFSLSPIRCPRISRIPRTRSLPRRLSDNLVDDQAARVPFRSRIPIAQWRMRSSVRAPCAPERNDNAQESFGHQARPVNECCPNNP